MFINISWADYIAFVTLLLIVYYLFIGIKFYSYELKQLLGGKRNIPADFVTDKKDTLDNANFQLQEIQPALFTSHQKYTSPVKETDDIHQHVEELTASLKETIAVAYNKQYVKEEFILSLQLLVKKFHFLKGSPYQVAINNLIASECEKYGYIHLSAEELAMLWSE